MYSVSRTSPRVRSAGRFFSSIGVALAAYIFSRIPSAPVPPIFRVVAVFLRALFSRRQEGGIAYVGDGGKKGKCRNGEQQE